MAKRSNINRDFEEAKKVTPPQPTDSEDGPVSKVQMQDLIKQLSEPALKLEITPQGAVTRQVRNESDQKIADEIDRIQKRLAEHRHTAKKAFNRSR